MSRSRQLKTEPVYANMDLLRYNFSVRKDSSAPTSLRCTRSTSAKKRSQCLPKRMQRVQQEPDSGLTLLRRKIQPLNGCSQLTYALSALFPRRRSYSHRSMVSHPRSGCEALAAGTSSWLPGGLRRPWNWSGLGRERLCHGSVTQQRCQSGRSNLKG